jgi:hypothetical protein
MKNTIILKQNSQRHFQKGQLITTGQTVGQKSTAMAHHQHQQDNEPKLSL